MDQKAMQKLSYGLYVLTAKEGKKDNGCIIHTAVQAAFSPNQLSICVNKANNTHNMIRNTGKFTLSVLSQSAYYDLFQHFGFQTGRQVDKFADFAPCKRAANGLYYITQGTNAYLSVSVRRTIDLGSHTMFIGEVTDMKVLSEEPSATYEYYQSVIKPKTPQGPDAQGRTVWRCSVCGHEVEGETLPEGFVCPVCKHSADYFEKVG